MNKHINTIIALLLMPFGITSSAQKIKIGTYTFKDGAVYQGDLVGGRPHGKGRTEFKNGDIYEGEYVK